MGKEKRKMDPLVKPEDEKNQESEEFKVAEEFKE